ncbi:peroxisome biogenesis protein 7-like [Musa acuminata AAA Group]|uniref:peroxisome biogenesis protein 7-like n=1 Tax=Musa acuminata AAA Group TaxID=214697 RepID=UPI0031D18195
MALPGIRIWTRYRVSAVRFSRFDDSRIIVGTRDRFNRSHGLHVLQLSPTPSGGSTVDELATFDTLYGVNDCCWSQSQRSLAVSALTDGSVKVWDTSLPPAANPVGIFREHIDQVRSVDWNPADDCFLSASSDAKIKFWVPDRNNSYYTFQEHLDRVNAVAWNDIQPHVFASASDDHTVGLWDIRDNRFITRIPVNHPGGLVSCNWNKYSEFHLATASGTSINVWDVRTTQMPLVDFSSHNRNVCRICFSPHRANMLLSCSVDHTVRAWDTQAQASIARYDLHDDSVYGIDMSVHIEDLIASAGRDKLVNIWRASPHQRLLHSP